MPRPKLKYVISAQVSSRRERCHKEKYREAGDRQDAEPLPRRQQGHSHGMWALQTAAAHALALWLASTTTSHLLHLFLAFSVAVPWPGG